MRLSPKPKSTKSDHNWELFNGLSWRTEEARAVLATKARIGRYGSELGARSNVELFLSTFENRIDKKGRLSVPAPFRAVLERRRDPLFLFKSLTEPCLEGCGAERIEQIVDAIDSMDSLSSEVATLQTMLSSAQEMRLDAEGRIMLSADFIEFAELDDIALYAGIGRSFQIWLPDRYRNREAGARARAKTDGLPSLRLGRGATRPTVESGDR